MSIPFILATNHNWMIILMGITALVFTAFKIRTATRNSIEADFLLFLFGFCMAFGFFIYALETYYLAKAGFLPASYLTIILMPTLQNASPLTEFAGRYLRTLSVIIVTLLNSIVISMLWFILQHKKIR